MKARTHVLYITLLLTLSSHVLAMIPYVDPQPGENIWRITSRSGTAIDYLLDQVNTTSLILNDIYILEQSMSVTLDNLYILEQTTNETVNNIYVLEVDTNEVVHDIYALEQSMSTTLNNLYELESKCCSCTAFLSQSDMPITITQPGHYCVTEDLSGAQTLITITSSNVLLDLRGYSVSTSVGNAIEITGGSEQVTIKNGTVTALLGFGISIDTLGTQIIIQDVTAEQCSIGFYIYSDTNVRFIACTAQQSSHGFFDDNITGSNIHSYEECSALNNGYGFNLQYPGPVSVSKCTANQNTQHGYLVAYADILTVNNCYAIQNTFCGFILGNINNGTVTQCSAMRNGSLISEAFGSGFFINSSTNVTCMSCTALDNFACGFSCQDGANAQFFNNFSNHNTVNGGTNYSILGTSGIVVPSSDVFINYVVSWWTNIDGGN